MIPGAKMLFEGRISAKSYVRNGLIGMWDGIENVGFSKHSANTLTWKNLGSLGSAYDATRIAKADAWTGNGAVFSNGDTGYVFEIPGYFMRDRMGGEWSYELVFSPGNVWIYGNRFSGIFGNHGSTKGVVGGQADGDSETVSFALHFPSVPLWNPIRTEYFSIGTVCTVTTAASNASHAATTWKDAVQVSNVYNVDVQLTFDQPGTYIGSAYFGRNPSEGHRVFDGTIHCVRVYDRPLSEMEVQRNHLIDVKRFWA